MTIHLDKKKKGIVYLLRNGDLYKIGTCENLQKELEKLSPDEVIKVFQVNEPKSLIARLYRRYKSERVPDSTYFRLSDDQKQDCIKQLTDKGDLPLTLGEEVDVGFNALLILFLVSFFFFLCIGSPLLLSLSYSIVLASMPMWILAILGNFGGYDLKDLPLFSSWINRSKAFFIAISLNCISFVLYELFKYIDN